jgi:hypothetical protein
MLLEKHNIIAEGKTVQIEESKYHQGHHGVLGA